jgi:citrate lyase subunit alpha/citrate CoA-transferase
LQKLAYDLTGKPEQVPKTDEIVAVVEYRDGTIIDTICRPRAMD